MALGGSGTGATSASAIKGGEVFVEINLRDKLTGSLNQVQRKFQAFSKRINQIGIGVGKLFGATALGGAAASPIVDTFARYDTAIRTTRAVTSATGDEFARLDTLVRRLGATTTFTAVEVADLSTVLGRAGFKVPQIEKALADVLNLARATATEAPLAAEIVGKSLSMFREDASQAVRFSDALAYSANNYNTTLEKIGEGLRYYGLIARQADVPFEEALAAITIFQHLGRDSTQAGVDLRRLTILMRRSEATMKTFGFSAFDANGKFVGLFRAMKMLEESVKGLTDEQRTEKFDKFFAILGITGAEIATEFMPEMAKLSKEYKNQIGYADKTARMMESGLGGALLLLKSAFEGVRLAIGDGMAPALMEFGMILIFSLEAVRQFVKENQQFITVATRLALVFATLVTTAAGIVGIALAFKLLGVAIGIVTGVIGLFWAALTSPLVLIGAAIVALALQFEKVRDSAIGTFNSVAGAFSFISTVISQAFTGIYDALKKNDMALAMEIAATSIKLIWTRLFISMRELWNDFRDFFSTGWVNLTTTIARLFNDMIYGLISLIATFVDKFSNQIADMLDAVNMTTAAAEVRATGGQWTNLAVQTWNDEEARIREEGRKRKAAFRAAREVGMQGLRDNAQLLQDQLNALTAQAAMVKPTGITEAMMKLLGRGMNFGPDLGGPEFEKKAGQLVSAAKGTFFSTDYRRGIGVGPATKIEEKQLDTQKAMLENLEEINDQILLRFE